MEHITLYLQLMAGAFGFCILAIWLKELIQLGTALLLSPKFGFKLHHFSMFGFEFRKQDGKWECSRGRHSLLIQSMPTVDLTQHHEPEELERMEKQLEAVRILILLAVSGILFALTFPSMLRLLHGDGSILSALPAGLGIGMVWHSLVTLGIRLYVYGVMMKKLPGYVQSLLKRLRAGERFGEMGLRPIETLPYKNPSQMEKMFYYSFYIPAMIETGQIGALQQPIREMTAYYRDRDYVIADTGNYYWLVFYYSRYELNPTAATHFLNRIRPTLEKDKDVNAQRVLAYYAFGIEQDFPKARQYLEDAYAVLEKCPSVGERELERKLLRDLDGFLKAKGF